MKINQDGRTYYLGKWAGRIIDVNDPEKAGRVRAIVPDVYDDVQSPWAMSCLPSNDFKVPRIGDQVWFEFEQGDPERPIYVGYTPSFSSGNTPAAGAQIGEDDDSTALLTGKGGAAMTVTVGGEEKKILEPATTTQSSYGDVQSLRVGQTFVEVDGSPDNQRLQMYHESGSFFEIGKSGQMLKVSKGMESDWTKGSRTTAITGQFTQAVGGPSAYSYKASVDQDFGGDLNVKIKGDTLHEQEGSLKSTFKGGYELEIAGQASLSAGSVKDVSSGDRSTASLGNNDVITTGAYTHLIGNAQYPTNPIGRNVVLAQGVYNTTVTNGDYVISVLGAGGTYTATATSAMTLTAGAAMTLTAAAVVTVTGTQILLNAVPGGDGALLGTSFNQIAWKTLIQALLNNPYYGNLGAKTPPSPEFTAALNSILDLTPMISQTVRVGL